VYGRSLPEEWVVVKVEIDANIDARLLQISIRKNLDKKAKRFL